MYLYNGGTTEYQCSTIGRFHPTRYRYTGSTELLHHAIGSVGRSCTKQNPTLIFGADYIEHHFEARATLLLISDALCNRLFLFSFFVQRIRITQNSRLPVSIKQKILKNENGWVA